MHKTKIDSKIDKEEMKKNIIHRGMLNLLSTSTWVTPTLQHVIDLKSKEILEMPLMLYFLIKIKSKMKITHLTKVQIENVTKLGLVRKKQQFTKF